MVSFSRVLVSGLAVSSWAGLGTAKPVVPRNGPGDIAVAIADIIKSILKATQSGTQQKDVYTYDIKTFPQYCDLYMETRDGGNCYATVECKDGGKKLYKEKYGKWDQCYVGGTTRFEDPRIGKFEIQFRTKDGFEGQGLTEPIFRLESFQNWKTWDVTAQSIKTSDARSCERGLTPLRCDQGPFLCRHVTSGNAVVKDGRVRRWSCGVPVKGDQSLMKLPDLKWPYLENGAVKDGYKWTGGWRL
ncbi:hypothetical protein DE146DRAFT_777386 [Phaeosphaeria sp. MPI-PUGE-AT-0046c]|nr:hypothetical protein DE146DRAFT_777386 [Phaeosphaeria sp. MPI-PUGE-AT-0046c]